MSIFNLAKSYSFGDIAFNIKGVKIGGFGEEGGVTFSPVTPERTTTMVGADGQVTAVQGKDRRWTMEVELMETSVSNAFMNGVQADQESAKGPAKTKSYLVRMAMQDRNTGESMTSAQVIFQGPPEVTKKGTATSRIYTAVLPSPIYIPATL